MKRSIISLLLFPLWCLGQSNRIPAKLGAPKWTNVHHVWGNQWEHTIIQGTDTNTTSLHGKDTILFLFNNEASDRIEIKGDNAIVSDVEITGFVYSHRTRSSKTICLSAIDFSGNSCEVTLYLGSEKFFQIVHREPFDIERWPGLIEGDDYRALKSWDEIFNHFEKMN